MKKYYRITNDDLVEFGESEDIIPNDAFEYIDELKDEVKNKISLQEQRYNTSIKIENSLKYLSDTDFYYIRKAETGEDVPLDIVTKRVEAREFLRSKGY